ncbi:hypothetical protein SELMODRAFT_432168 [Selaginella moellendorffii]|uniref:Protein kinase domain-containing protein n=1 Tax=Selaginella moellendorffii TaxID=88036 RepID=D8TF69_SELML|nr:hypothetical protein SELMODRAFT_432168 [Selaginella moellendorffii]
MKLLTLMLLLSSTYYSRVLANFLRGSTVTTGSPWRSPEGTFGFGFVMPESSSTRNFNLAIWYDIDPKKTVVWMAMANGQLVQCFAARERELSCPWKRQESCMAELRLSNEQPFARAAAPHARNPSLGYTRLISQSGAYQLVLNSGQVLLKNLKLEIPQKYWSIANPTLNSTMTCLDDETGEHVLNNNVCQPDRSLKFPAVLNLSVLSFYDATGKSWASGSMSSQDYALDYECVEETYAGRRWQSRDLQLRPEEQEWLLERRLASRHARVRHLWNICAPGFHRVDPNDESKGCDYDIPGACQNSPISVKLVHVNRADYYFNDYNFDSTIKSLEELGSGGFGSVYRGNMAMKNITTVNQAEKQFKAEVSTIGRVHHVNLAPPPRLLRRGRPPPSRLRVHGKQFSRSPPLGLVLIRRLARDLLNLGDTTLNRAGDCQRIDIPPREVWRAHRYQATKRAAGRELRPKALMELGGRDKECENAPLPPPGEWYFPIYAFHKYMTSELESIADPNPASGAQDRAVVHPPGSRIQASDEPRDPGAKRRRRWRE